MAQEGYKTILSSVRPARVAVLVDRSDPEWQNSCLGIIEFLATKWGGAYDIIVPTNGNDISSPFWQILEVFDPDCVYAYQSTGEDIKASDPAKFNSAVEHETQKFLRANAGADETISRQHIEELLSQVVSRPFAISESLEAQIKARLAPFWFEKHVVQAGSVTRGDTARFPLTELTSILPNSSSIQKVVTFNTSLRGIPPLWPAAVLGRVHDSFSEALRKIKFEHLNLDIGEHERGGFIDRVLQNDAVVEMGSVGRGIVPFGLTMVGLGKYRSSKFQDWDAPVLVIAGNTTEDFCLYYCLSRIREDVVWLVPEWVTQTQEALRMAKAGERKIDSNDLAAMYFVFAVQKLNKYGQRRTFLLSASSDRAGLEAMLEGLGEAKFSGDGLRGWEIVEFSEALAKALIFPFVAYEEGSQLRQQTKHFSNGVIAGFLDTPKPKNFKTIHPVEHRWITEFSVPQHQLPSHPELGSWVVRDGRLGTYGTRSGRNGVAFLCPHVAYFRGWGDVDSFLIRPEIRLPETSEVFEYLSLAVGLECTISDKGFFAQESIRKFGGLEQAAKFLRAEPKRQLLEKFLDQSRPEPRVRDEGVYLNQRRYLDFASVRKILGSEQAAGVLIDEMVCAGIFYRGLVFKCEFCKNADWFSVNEITHEFKCKRCDRSQVYARRHWREPEEPSWYYQLDEIFYQGLRNDMVVPLLALDYLRDGSQESFLYTNELAFRDHGAEKPWVESDICCIPAGVLTLGEAKKDSRLGSTAKEENETLLKYRRLSSTLGARQMVFATFAEDWSPTTAAKIRKVFEAEPVTLTFLAKAQLLG